MLCHRITSKYSTDTFIEQAQFTDSHRFFWKGSQKANCLSVYANEQSKRLLARTLSDKSLPTRARDLQPTRSVTRPAHIYCYALYDRSRSE
jgi:hypothetical protein